jgi:hypothetical protein
MLLLEIFEDACYDSVVFLQFDVVNMRRTQSCGSDVRILPCALSTMMAQERDDILNVFSSEQSLCR